MTKTIQSAVLIASCLAIASLTHVIGGQRLHAVSLKFKEFTIVRAERSQGRSPHTLNRVLLEAQRADGSRVSGEVVAGNPGQPSRRFVFLAPERIRAEVNDDLRAKTTYYMTDLPAPRPPAADPQCGFSRLSPSSNPRFQGEAEVLGYRTMVIQTEARMDNGESYLHTDWKAPELDCAVLKVVEDRRDDAGKVTGHFEMQAIEVAVGTPAANLFDVPGDYTEMPPSQMHAAQLEKSGGLASRMPVNVKKRLEREDQKYFDNHRAAGIK